MPLFLGGLLEDITGNVSPRNRLLAAFCSAGLAVLITGSHLEAGDFWLLNNLFIFPVIAIPVTILISAGIANAFNIIDGVNGFSAGVALIISCVLGYVCYIYDEPNLGYFCYMIAIAIIPFLLLNFPFGYIFLGDAGAYTLGHLLSWVAIILLFRHPEISAWAIFCVFFWPIADTGFAICRRLIKGRPINEPDRMHFHQLVMRCLIIYSKGRIPRSMANPLSTLIILPFCLFVALLGTLFVQNNSLSLIVILCSVLTFIVSYRLLIFTARLKW